MSDKPIFEQLNNALSLKELIHITQTLFKDAFKLPARSISLHLRPFDTHSAQECFAYSQAAIEKKVEIIIDSEETELSTYLKKSKILIYEEPFQNTDVRCGSAYLDKYLRVLFSNT